MSTAIGPVVPAGISAKAVRDWAIQNGHESLARKRGRLPQSVIDAYLEAHPESREVVA